MRSLGRGSLVLVTGGAGFIGAAVVRRLLADGYRVRVLDDLSRGRKERLDAGTDGWDLELLVDDVRAERAVKDAVKDVAAVVHLAAGSPRPTGAHEERQAHDVTVTGTLNLLSAARAAGVGRFVFTSSASVYGPKVPYLMHEDVATHPATAEGAQKLAAETFVRLYHARDGLPTCVLRLFSVYGPGQDGSREDAPVVARFLTQARAGQPMTIHGDGQQTRDLVHVDDVAAAVASSLKSPGVVGRAFNIASGEGVAVRHVAARISELAGGLAAPRYLPARAGEPKDVHASIAAAAATLGYRPKVRLNDGLARTVAAAGLGRTEAPGLNRRPAPPPPIRAKGTPPPFPATPPPKETSGPLFSDRPPSWQLQESTRPVPTSSDSIPVFVQEEDPLWT